MNKKFLKRYTLVFTLFTVFLFLSYFILYKTGFNNFRSNQERYFADNTYYIFKEDSNIDNIRKFYVDSLNDSSVFAGSIESSNKNYENLQDVIANLDFSKLSSSKKKVLASNWSECVAESGGWGNAFIDVVTPGFIDERYDGDAEWRCLARKAAIDAISDITGYSCDTNVEGTASCLTAGLADGSGKSLIGCTFSDYQNSYVATAAASPEILGSVVTNEALILPPESSNCNPEEGLIFVSGNSLDNSKGINLDAVGLNNTGGLLGAINSNLINVYSLRKDVVNTNTYFSSVFEEDSLLSLLAPDSVKAFITDERVSSVTFSSVMFSIWSSVRNFSYLFIVIPAIFFGFAIMFRQNLGGQTVINLQRAIPRLVITMLLITFSYPLFALLAKLIEPLNHIVINILNTSFKETLSIQNGLTFKSAIASAVNVIFGLMAVLNQGWVVFILGAVLIIIYIIALLKWVYTSVSISIKAGFYIAASPILFLFGAMPGKEDLQKNIIKYILSLLLVFEIIPIVFFVHSLLIDLSYKFYFEQLSIVVAAVLLLMAFSILLSANKIAKKGESLLGVDGFSVFGGGDQQRRR